MESVKAKAAINLNKTTERNFLCTVKYINDVVQDREWQYNECDKVSFVNGDE